MADVVFAILAALLLTGGLIGAAIVWIAAAMIGATNTKEAEKLFRWILVPLAVAGLGVYFGFNIVIGG